MLGRIDKLAAVGAAMVGDGMVAPTPARPAANAATGTIRLAAMAMNMRLRRTIISPG